MAAVNKGRNHLRDASFSSYLDTADTDFVRSLAASMHESSPIFTPSRQSSASSPSSSMSKRQTRGPLGELGVFGAESYFADKMDRHDRTPSFRSVEDQAPETKPKPEPRTPSIRSQSSWSSRNTDQIKPKKSIAGPWFLAGLQCKGSCYDVKPPVYPAKQSSTNQRKGFWEDQVVHQPRLNTVLARQPERMASSFAYPDTQEEDPRKSIEVFGLNPKTQKEEEDHEKDGGEMSFLMEKELSMLSWDAIPTQAQNSRRSSGSCRYDDMESDASSDLFDIPVFPVEMSPVIAPYEPSEASIEWSVVTASATEFSAASELDEEKQVGSKKKTTSFKPKPLRSGGFMGCKNDKAVEVVNPANATLRMASFPPIPPKKSSFASKAASTCPSSSARAPRPIYMY